MPFRKIFQSASMGFVIFFFRQQIQSENTRKPVSKFINLDPILCEKELITAIDGPSLLYVRHFETRGERKFQGYYSSPGKKDQINPI